jgi:2-polyprenyl-3-methyl-5-hydroxy-6-metoxy-1,4-benzoquinol methylase
MKKHDWTKSFENNDIQVIACKACGFIHQWPLPTQDELDTLYAEIFYEKEKPHYIQDTDADREWRNMQDREKLHAFESFLEKPVDRKPRILDIGSSSGVFLEIFLEGGWDVLGIEPSCTAGLVAKDRGLPTLITSIERVSLQDLNGAFDAVNMREVIDHVLSPYTVLQKIHDELLLPGGIICIETGNEFNEFQLAVCEHYQIPKWWIVPDHISYFDRMSLEYLLQKIGFEILLVEATFPLELFALQGDNYVGNPEVGRACHLKRVHFEMCLNRIGKDTVKGKLYRALAQVGLGRGIILYARKNSGAI